MTPHTILKGQKEVEGGGGGVMWGRGASSQAPLFNVNAKECDQ